MPGGRLLVCATPVGNLGDVTLRVLDALRDADLIAAEDTRISRRLLARYGISTPLEPYHAHNLDRRTPELVERMRGGARIALVSDAGTPGISDPGAHLVDACITAGVSVEVLPGPSAIVTALVASGLPTHAFYFGGFLPRKSGPRGRKLESLALLDATLVFYESPRRAAVTLAALAGAFPGREGALARELTKVHEEVVRGPLEVIAAEVATRELKGEVVLLVGAPLGPAVRNTPSRGRVLARVEEIAAEGAPRSAAVRRAAEEFGIRRSEVYRIAHGDRGVEPDGSGPRERG